MGFAWIEERPLITGWYGFKKKGEKGLKMVDVHFGRWQEKQNPKEMYGDDLPVEEMKGYWFGPIPGCDAEDWGDPIEDKQQD